jgi:hypothetical protein
VAYWSKAVRAAGGSVDVLQAVIEKSVVLGLATNTSAASQSLAELVTTYASTLATQVRRWAGGGQRRAVHPAKPAGPARGSAPVDVRIVRTPHVCVRVADNTRAHLRSSSTHTHTHLQGRMGAALRYLEMVPGEASTGVAVLKDRIYRCLWAVDSVMMRHDSS